MKPSPPVILTISSFTFFTTSLPNQSSITFGVITVFDSQKEARNIESGFAPGHKNVHFLREDTNQPEQPPPKQEISA
jgi:hypothetical protein